MKINKTILIALIALNAFGFAAGVINVVLYAQAGRWPPMSISLSMVFNVVVVYLLYRNIKRVG